MSKLLDAMAAIMRADADRLASRILARQIEESRANPDGCARVNVQPVRGSLPDVPVEQFAAKSKTIRNGNGPVETITYSKPVEGPTPTAQWIEANRGIVSKGLPQARKHLAYKRTYEGHGLALGHAKQEIISPRIPCTHGCADALHTPPMPGLRALDTDWHRIVDPLADPVPAWLRILVGPYWTPPVKMAPARQQRTREQKEELMKLAREEARRKMTSR